MVFLFLFYSFCLHDLHVFSLFPLFLPFLDHYFVYFQFLFAVLRPLLYIFTWAIMQVDSRWYLHCPIRSLFQKKIILHVRLQVFRDRTIDFLKLLLFFIALVIMNGWQSSVRWGQWLSSVRWGHQRSHFRFWSVAKHRQQRLLRELHGFDRQNGVVVNAWLSSVRWGFIPVDWLPPDDFFKFPTVLNEDRACPATLPL